MGILSELGDVHTLVHVTTHGPLIDMLHRFFLIEPLIHFTFRPVSDLTNLRVFVFARERLDSISSANGFSPTVHR